MLTLPPAKEPEVGTVCEKHQRALDAFCQEDQTPTCVVCHLSGDHRGPTAVPIEEAAGHYKDQIWSRLESMKKERDEILSFKLSGEDKSQELLKQLETEKQKIVSEFQQLRHFLEEEERIRLAQLEELNQEIENGRAEYLAKISEEISSFSSLINEMEQKCQQPAREFLQVRRCCLVHPPAGAGSVTDTIRPCPRAELCPSRSDSLSAANVTLDPDTAHPKLIVSADRKSVRWGVTQQDLPDNPERFESWTCVLGCEGFTSGQHYWEVEFGGQVEMGKGICVVGVARESVNRKAEIDFTPEEGIWAVGCGRETYWAHMSPAQRIPLSPSRRPCRTLAPRRIWVYLDYEGGKVAFFDAGRGKAIATFPLASFIGERIHPFFRVLGLVPLTLCP
ncbi:E3 ubiquitin-protein ligase TRIM15-like [Pangshura tecta]